MWCTCRWVKVNRIEELEDPCKAKRTNCPLFDAGVEEKFLCREIQADLNPEEED